MSSLDALSVTLRVSPLLVGLAAALALAAFTHVGPLRMALFAAASGIGPFLLVRSRWRASELLMVPLATSSLLWAVLGTIMGRPPLREWASSVPTLVAGGLAIIAWRQKRRIEVELSLLDAAVLLAAGLAAIPIVAVFAHNGLHGERYLAHGWFALDSFYLFALAQESVERGGWPSENPFVAGVANYYPSFSHVGLGALASQGCPTVAISIVWLAPYFLIASLGLWVASCMRAAAARSFGEAAVRTAITLLGIAGVVGLRPDLFIYPQTQAFAFGWLALMVWLGATEPTESLSLAAAGVVALALVLAHAVTGAAAVVLVLGTSLPLLATHQTRQRGMLMAAGGLALAVVFWWVNVLPYNGPHGPFSLSSLSALRPVLRPWSGPMAGVALAAGASWRKPTAALPALGVVGLGAWYYVHGSTLLDANERWFVLFNAERFLHLGLLFSLLSAVRGDRWIALAAVLLVAVSAAWQPTNLARAASRRLIEEPPRVIDASEMALYERIRRELPVDARILFQGTDQALAAFSGRAQSPAQSNNIWGLNTLPASEFDERVAAVVGLSSLPPAQWPSVLDRWQYSHALLQFSIPAEIDPASARRWLEANLPAGELVVQMTSGNRFLLARRRVSPRS